LQQDDSALEVFKILDLTTNEINALFGIFSAIDILESGAYVTPILCLRFCPHLNTIREIGSVRAEEFFAHFHMENGELENNLFMVFDEGIPFFVILSMYY
jgi:hypothetical protein